MTQVFKRLQTAALILTAIFLYSCGHRHHEVTKGFYYWKTVYSPSAFEMNMLRELQVQKMYVRLFDVDWDQEKHTNVPVGTLKIDEVDSAYQFVPVIFITQRTLTNLDTAGIKRLAQQISSFAGVIFPAGWKADEVQVDCDWTAGTRDKYFRLLSEFKQTSFFKGKTLSCTIRMHQVKFSLRSGIPPVDKGLLMCYNMGNMKKLTATNSILDAREAKNYLHNIERYPLPLDVALPLFRWCVLFRGQRFVGILRDVPPELVKNVAAFKLKNRNIYQCTRDTVWRGYNFKVGDLIKTDEPVYSDIAEIATFTSKRINNSKINVVLFSCDSLTLSKYSHSELETLYSTYF